MKMEEHRTFETPKHYIAVMSVVIVCKMSFTSQSDREKNLVIVLYYMIPHFYDGVRPKMKLR